MRDILKCYTSGKKVPESPNEGTVSFAVPEFGILFRCQVSGSPADLEIIAFLSMLRFVEYNKEIFQKRHLNIYCDFPLLIYLMNGGVVEAATGLNAVREQAKKYTKGILFNVKWIDPKNNRASGSAADIPALPADSDLKIKAFPNLKINRSASSSGQDLNFTDF